VKPVAPWAEPTPPLYPGTGPINPQPRPVTVQVDSYRFLDFVTRQMVKAWIAKEPLRNIPWTALRKPVRECSVAIISSGAIALKSDTPFDQETERRNPWWGDPTHRVIPRDARSGDVEFYHLHIDPTCLIEETVPKIIEGLRNDEVDLVLLVPT